MNEYVKSDAVRYGAAPTWGGLLPSILEIRRFVGRLHSGLLTQPVSKS